VCGAGVWWKKTQGLPPHILRLSPALPNADAQTAVGSALGPTLLCPHRLSVFNNFSVPVWICRWLLLPVGGLALSRASPSCRLTAGRGARQRRGSFSVLKEEEVASAALLVGGGEGGLVVVRCQMGVTVLKEEAASVALPVGTRPRRWPGSSSTGRAHPYHQSSSFTRRWLGSTPLSVKLIPTGPPSCVGGRAPPPLPRVAPSVLRCR
jgi:hypothetical protein